MLKLISSLRRARQERFFIIIIFSPLFLSREQSNKIIIIIKGTASLPSRSDMLSAKTQIKSFRRSEKAMKTGALL